MSVDEVRMRLRRKLEELVGVSEAEILLDRPPGGWGDLVTNHTLDLRFDAFEARMGAKLDRKLVEVDRRFDRIEARLESFEHELLAKVDRSLRNQTWVVISALIAIMGVVASIRL